MRKQFNTEYKRPHTGCRVNPTGKLLTDDFMRGIA